MVLIYFTEKSMKIWYLYLSTLCCLSIVLDCYGVLTITNGPVDATACNGATVNMPCGFTGADPALVVPTWRIIRRNSSGSVISNITIAGSDIISNADDGLVWVPDRTSGMDNAPNSRLEVGPVDLSYDQSSYQCIFQLLDPVTSGIGTITLPAPVVSDITSSSIECTNFTISWTSSVGLACGVVSHTITLSPQHGTMVPMGDTSYRFTGLTSNTDYTVTVFGANDNGNGNSVTTMVSTLVITQIPPPLTISVAINLSNGIYSIMVSWMAPSVSNCIPITNYLIRLTFNGTTVTSSPIALITTSVDLSIIFTGLSVPVSNTVYSIVALSVNSAGMATSSSAMAATFILQSCSVSLKGNNITISCTLLGPQEMDIQVTATCTYSCTDTVTVLDDSTSDGDPDDDEVMISDLPCGAYQVNVATVDGNDNRIDTRILTYPANLPCPSPGPDDWVIAVIVIAIIVILCANIVIILVYFCKREEINAYDFATWHLIVIFILLYLTIIVLVAAIVVTIFYFMGKKSPQKIEDTATYQDVSKQPKSPTVETDGTEGEYAYARTGPVSVSFGGPPK